MLNRQKKLKKKAMDEDSLEELIEELERESSPMKQVICLRLESMEFQGTVSKMFVRMALLLLLQAFLITLVLYNVLKIIELTGGS